MKNKKASLLIIAMCYFGLFSTYSAFAETLRVGADTWPPFRMYDGERFTGVGVDILDEVVYRLNTKYGKEINIQRKYTPWPRILLNMKHGKTDLMTDVAVREEREKFIQYVYPPYYTCTTVFYVLKNDNIILNKYNDLHRLQVGVCKDSAYFSPFDNDPKIKKAEVTLEDQLLKMLELKRFDTFIGTDCQVDYQIANTQFEKIFKKANYSPGNSVELHLGISKKSAFAEDINLFNNVMREIVEEGKPTEFYKKHQTSNTKYQE